MVEQLDVETTAVARNTVYDVLDAQLIHKRDHVGREVYTRVPKKNVQCRSIHDNEVWSNTASG
jgi:hypothetical protein